MNCTRDDVEERVIVVGLLWVKMIWLVSISFVPTVVDILVCLNFSLECIPLCKFVQM